MPKSVLDAIKLGNWSFEPERLDPAYFDSTRAMPGSKEKVHILAERARQGLPLWHDRDRMSYDEPLEE